MTNEMSSDSDVRIGQAIEWARNESDSLIPFASLFYRAWQMPMTLGLLSAHALARSAVPRDSEDAGMSHVIAQMVRLLECAAETELDVRYRAGRSNALLDLQSRILAESDRSAEPLCAACIGRLTWRMFDRFETKYIDIEQVPKCSRKNCRYSSQVDRLFLGWRDAPELSGKLEQRLDSEYEQIWELIGGGALTFAAFAVKLPALSVAVAISTITIAVGGSPGRSETDVVPFASKPPPARVTFALPSEKSPPPPKTKESRPSSSPIAGKHARDGNEARVASAPSSGDERSEKKAATETDPAEASPTIRGPSSPAAPFLGDGSGSGDKGRTRAPLSPNTSLGVDDSASNRKGQSRAPLSPGPDGNGEGEDTGIPGGSAGKESIKIIRKPGERIDLKPIKGALKELLAGRKSPCRVHLGKGPNAVTLLVLQHAGGAYAEVEKGEIDDQAAINELIGLSKCAQE